MTGKLSSDDNADFVVQYNYFHTVDTGVTVPIADGSHVPVAQITRAAATTPINLEEPVVLGELTGTSEAAGKPEHESKLRLVLKLTKSKPADH